jgi:predicted 3-demethylubiquinone-9 3-methyltransferase (glyoxalase superfamily)
MQKIIPHLWYDKEAKEAAALYTSLFPDSSITHTSTLSGTPSGDTDLVSFTLAGRKFMAISAGPYFKFNPSISLFAIFPDEASIDAAWAKLSEGGGVLMEYGEYPWAKKYGWLSDRYGLSWQLSLSEHHDMADTITPALMFTGAVAGKAKEAIDMYTSLFPESSIDLLSHYEEGDGDSTDYLEHARFTLAGDQFIAMDSSFDHKFTFNEAFSLLVSCDTQEEIDAYWEKLSAVPEAEQCGWLKDRFGVSWQISPAEMEEMMASGDAKKIGRVTQAFLTMKKFDIATLRKAYEGE